MAKDPPHAPQGPAGAGFEYALALMRTGARMKRLGWAEQGAHIGQERVTSGDLSFDAIVYCGNKVFIWHPSQEDMLTLDWVVVG